MRKLEPSESFQLVAVRRFGDYIRYIKNPSEAVQLAASKTSGHAICHIPNPSEAVQLSAVSETGEAIKYIRNPSEAVQLVAVESIDTLHSNITSPKAINKFHNLIMKVINRKELIYSTSINPMMKAI